MLVTESVPLTANMEVVRLAWGQVRGHEFVGEGL